MAKLDKLDMSLDDLLKKNRKPGGGGGGGGRKSYGGGGDGGGGRKVDVPRKRHELVVVKNNAGVIGKRGGRGGRGRGRSRGRGRGRGRGYAARASTATRPEPNANVFARRNDDGSVVVLHGGVEAATISKGGEVKLNVGGQWTEEMMATINDALGPTLDVTVSAPDGVEGDWFVTDGHIWLVRMASDAITLPPFGYPPETRPHFGSMVLQNSGGVPAETSVSREVSGE